MKSELTTDEKMEALAQYEEKAVQEFTVFEDSEVFKNRVNRMQIKMQQHGITTEQFKQYKEQRPSKKAILASIEAQRPK